MQFVHANDFIVVVYAEEFIFVVLYLCMKKNHYFKAEQQRDDYINNWQRWLKVFTCISSQCKPIIINCAIIFAVYMQQCWLVDGEIFFSSSYPRTFVNHFIINVDHIQIHIHVSKMTSGRRVIMKLLRFANKLKFSERLNKKLLHFCSSFFFWCSYKNIS